MSEISIYDPAMLVWVDETGCDRCNNMRKFEYSVRDIPPRDHRLLARGVRYSGIARLTPAVTSQCHTSSGPHE